MGHENGDAPSMRASINTSAGTARATAIANFTVPQYGPKYWAPCTSQMANEHCGEDGSPPQPALDIVDSAGSQRPSQRETHRTHDFFLHASLMGIGGSCRHSPPRRHSAWERAHLKRDSAARERRDCLWPCSLCLVGTLTTLLPGSIFVSARAHNIPSIGTTTLTHEREAERSGARGMLSMRFL